MKSDELLQQTLELAGMPVKQYEYRGSAEQYIVYNVRGSEVEVTSFGEGLNYSATETLGSATSPNGRVIESTSVYSRISYQVDGYFGVTVPAEKDKLVDIVKNN